MKEQTLLEMKNKVEATTRVLQQMLNEVMHLRELGVGTLETVKLMPGYEEALEKLKENMLEKNRAEKAENEKQEDKLPT